MKFYLRAHKVFYGMKAITFTLLEGEGASIPLEIDSIDDIDLEAIKREIRQTVYNQSWSDLAVKHTPEQVIELEGKEPLTLVEQIVVWANGVQLVYSPRAAS